ncbi:hypothetical protein DTO195F2_471 [Paecilomyces variotii]|nr:hypothetical protein DTO195F2_471 [Paecilomyces variotii]KAJ9306361.1 hypothetical protein DTO217A2_4100 [Paecilomyces variotii]KAJ9368511.1 hypothetical protein DTO282E5_6748 [Paecilomyces variotii]
MDTAVSAPGAGLEEAKRTPEPSPPPPPSSPILKHPNDPRAFLPQGAQRRKVRHLRRLAKPPEPELLHAGWLPRELRGKSEVEAREKLERKVNQRKNAKKFLQKQLQNFEEKEQQKELQQKRQKELEEWIAKSGWEEKYAQEELIEEEKQQMELSEDEIQLHAELEMHVQEWEQHEVQIYLELRFYLDQLGQETEERELQLCWEETRRSIEEQPWFVSVENWVEFVVSKLRQFRDIVLQGLHCLQNIRITYHGASPGKQDLKDRTSRIQFTFAGPTTTDEDMQDRDSDENAYQYEGTTGFLPIMTGADQQLQPAPRKRDFQDLETEDSKASEADEHRPRQKRRCGCIAI